MPVPSVKFYFDVRSPYAYLAREEVLALSDAFAVAVQPLPYAIALEAAFGTPDSRDPRALRKVKYLYMDVRRFANERGLTVRGTTRIFDPRIAHAAFLHAERRGRSRQLYDRLLPVFWDRRFDIEDEVAIAALLSEVDADGEAFGAYLRGDANQDLKRIAAGAEADGVFGVPSCVFQNELFWGADRVDMLR